MYQEFRLQQQHPHSAQYAAPDAAAATTTYSPTYYTEAVTVRATTPPPTTLRYAAYTQPAPAETTTSASSAPQPAAKSLHHRDEIQHELQMQLSQQIQVQLEQLQKLHELQHKMLHHKAAVSSTTQPPPQAVQQGSELVHRQVPLPPLVEYVPHHSPHYLQHLQQHVGVPGVTTASPVAYASTPPSVTPSPPPLTEPRYPEESQPLTSFIASSPPPPVGDAISNGFQPMPGPPPGPRHPDDSAGQGPDDTVDLSFQPFTEDATDPALPFYLLPPAEDSDSQFNRLREAVVPPPDGDADVSDGPSAPPTSSASQEQHLGDHVGEQDHRHSVRGKHRLRPPR
ncbi:hypothetical protein ONE63_001912 [Megalurothrips usitatus]|uniref:Uncharacterized protein n=1 Tax=Megalurothrips usitatus TaxID=439358 RepID=A0AAV7XE16_9NEOP|nr:hypothetical protein ONE63_001912 [Megalurothrips usitatus]